MNDEKRKNRGSALKEAIISAFSFGSRDINLEMVRESRKKPYVYTKHNGETIFLLAVDHRQQVYYDVNHQWFIPAEDLETERIKKLNLNVPSEELNQYVNLYFTQYDFINELEKKYVEYLQKVKELLKHVVVFQVQANVMLEDANGRINTIIDEEETQQEYLEEYLNTTKKILDYRKKLVGTTEKQEIGTLVYGYQTEPNSEFVYLLDEHSVCFPVESIQNIRNYNLPEYYAIQESMKPLNKNGLKSPVDVNYFYQQLIAFYTSKIDVYQSSHENRETVKKLSMKKNHK
jgi:hypothetical protein